MDYIYANLDKSLVDINRIDYIRLKKCDILHFPIDSLELGDYYLETKIVDSDKIIYTDLSDLSKEDKNISDKLDQEILDRTNICKALDIAIKNETNRTDAMINQLNENVHSQFSQLNKIIVDSINTINSGIEEERQERKEADNILQKNIDAETNRVNNMINTLNNNIKIIVDQLNQNITTIVSTINLNLDNESKERLKQDTLLNDTINKEIEDRKEADTTLTNNELRFTKEVGTTVAVGGIEKGTTFKDKKLIDIINDLLYPYVAFNITSLNLSPNNGGTFEKGSSVTVINSTIWLNLGSEPIVRVSIFDGDIKLGEKTENLVGNNISIPINLTISDYKILKTEVEDKYGTRLNRNSSSFNFVYPFYYGSLLSGVYDAENIKKLTKVVQGKGSKKFSFTHTDKCCVIAYPASYGNLKNIIDQNNFDVTSSFVKHEVKIIGLDEKEVSYFVYINAPATLSNFSITFNF